MTTKPDDRRQVALPGPVHRKLARLKLELETERGVALTMGQVVGESITRWVRQRDDHYARSQDPTSPKFNVGAYIDQAGT